MSKEKDELLTVNHLILLQMKYLFYILSERENNFRVEGNPKLNLIWAVTLDTETNFYLKIQNKCLMRSGIRESSTSFYFDTQKLSNEYGLGKAHTLID